MKTVLITAGANGIGLVMAKAFAGAGYRVWVTDVDAAMVATLASPLFCYYFLGASAYLPAVIFMSVMLVWRHKENIRKLLNGTESKIGEKKKADQAA